MEIIATRIYGANGIELSEEARKKVQLYTKLVISDTLRWSNMIYTATARSVLWLHQSVENMFIISLSSNINISFLYCTDPYCKTEGILHSHYIMYCVMLIYS